LITSPVFFIILIPTFILYWLIPDKYKIRQILLVISSFVFLYIFDLSAMIITLILTIYTYSGGYFIGSRKNLNLAYWLLIGGLLICLIFFKYIGLLVPAFDSLNTFVKIFPKFELKNILLPLGISYIVLKHISYLTDIKWGIIKKQDFIFFLTYSSFFTIFTAGPIERYEKFQPQLENRGDKFEWKYLDEGFQRIIFGLFKKFVLANWIAFFINPVLQNQNDYTFELKSLALLGFSLQIYFDFSGYSDIAIGSSRLFGFKIMENFNFPYLKQNISQFWRSWHISLSEWIRDYIFMPLARLSTNKIWFYFFAPVISMGICGIWHGAKWGFLLWGIWHGIGLSAYQIYRKNVKKKYANSIFVNSLSVLLTFIFVTLGWYFFIN